MDFYVKKTHELSETERRQMNDLFVKVFEKERSVEIMFNQYIHNPLGYSYHSFCVEEGIIQGAATYVPAHFICQGKKITMATGIDVMIAPKYRNFYEFRKIIKNVFKALKADGVPMIYGFPNDNSHPVYKTAGLMSDIGKLHTYCLPYRIGGIKKSLSPLNILSRLYCRCRIARAKLLSKKEEAQFAIHAADDYNATRYKRLDGAYSRASLTPESELYFKILNHEGVRTAFIIDITHKSSRAFALACDYLINNFGDRFDLILYPGYLPFGNHGLVRLPRKIEPKNFHFAAQILDKEALSADVVFDIKSWDVNLSLYDLI